MAKKPTKKKLSPVGAGRKKVETPWEGIPEGFSAEEYAGFVYLIQEKATLRKYVGKKFLWSTRKQKVKGKKRGKRVTQESDWRFYKSSSVDLKALIEEKGVEEFTFTILSFHKTRAETNYTEVREQFARDVLYSKIGDLYEYFNHCILNRYYRNKIKLDKDVEVE